MNNRDIFAAIAALANDCRSLENTPAETQRIIRIEALLALAKANTATKQPSHPV